MQTSMPAGKSQCLYGALHYIHAAQQQMEVQTLTALWDPTSEWSSLLDAVSGYQDQSPTALLLLSEAHSDLHTLILASGSDLDLHRRCE